MKERPSVSGSMAGHCRMEIYLLANGAVQEKPLPNVQRTFDLGHIIERAFFEPVLIGVGDGSDANVAEWVGPWWPEVGDITDYSTGEVINTKEWEIHDRQEEVEVDGFVGHTDGTIGKNGRLVVADVKTMPSLTWDRNIKGNLMENPFSREYVMQGTFYMEGKILKGTDVREFALICFNKENSKVMARFVKYDPALVAEMKERLAWAKSKSEPPPDWAWEKGQPIPLRCGYCGVREACARTRGQGLTLQVVKGVPKWIVS